MQNFTDFLNQLNKLNPVNYDGHTIIFEDGWEARFRMEFETVTPRLEVHPVRIEIAVVKLDPVTKEMRHVTTWGTENIEQDKQAVRAFYQLKNAASKVAFDNRKEEQNTRLFWAL